MIESGPGLRALAAPLLAAIAGARPTYVSLLRDCELSLAEFLQRGLDARLAPLQDRADYIEQAVRLAADAQGAAVGAALRARLQRSPVVYTANHLCIETFALTVQSMLVAALGEPTASVLPVEASGLIPADNASYPVGLLMARRAAGKPLRVPILDLSNRQRRQLSLGLPPFSAGDLQRAEQRLPALLRDAGVSAAEADALRRILNDVLGNEDVLRGADFRTQVERATPRLWPLWFDATTRRSMPGLTYACFESLRTPLLIDDLQHPQRLLHRLLFDRSLREAVVRELDGVPCCWSDGGRAAGSIFLWEVTAQGRAGALQLDGDTLVGGDGRRIALKVDAVSAGLRDGSLVPTSFLSLMVGLVRGLVQIGGFNQIDYLQAMQRGLSRALAEAGYVDWSAQLAVPPPPMLTAGLTGCLVAYADGTIASAGGIELIACGGLDRDTLERMRELRLCEAMAAELPGIARMLLGEAASRDLAPSDPGEWSQLLASRLPVFRLD